METPKEKLASILARNEESLKTFEPTGTMSQVMALKDFRALFIITCADARVHPEEIFGLKKGEINIIRNAAGRVTDDALRSVGVMGCVAPPEIIMVLHHTDCGGLCLTDDEIRANLAAKAPEHAHELAGRSFGMFGHIGLEQSVRDDVEILRKWPFLPKDTEVLGYVYETETGRVRKVD